METAIDSSGIILLAKADILREVCSIAVLKTTKEVENEVMAGLVAGKKDALFMQELLKENKMQTVKANNDLIEKFRKDFNLGSGEASIMALSVTRKIPMITDDNKARKIGKIIGLDILSSLDFPIILYSKGLITYDKAKACLETLKRGGWFSKNILAEAFDILKRMRGEKI